LAATVDGGTGEDYLFNNLPSDLDFGLHDTAHETCVRTTSQGGRSSRVSRGTFEVHRAERGISRRLLRVVKYWLGTRECRYLLELSAHPEAACHAEGRGFESHQPLTFESPAHRQVGSPGGKSNHPRISPSILGTSAQMTPMRGRSAAISADSASLSAAGRSPRVAGVWQGEKGSVHCPRLSEFLLPLHVSPTWR
jgi:hypothetical protein